MFIQFRNSIPKIQIILLFFIFIWLKDPSFRPGRLVQLVKRHVADQHSGLLVADDTILSEPRNQHIDLVPY